ncbi:MULTISPECIES: OmpA family protein [Sphingobacterium]|uniref:OmpA family protein n=1 Tax=Sphingobacterium TaxID=28453 RepID=UPI0013DAEBD2|nr:MULTISPECIES: OmpA family protein [unclassified Sphingobacterium]
MIPKPTDAFYISNLRIAEAGMDARSTLLKEGKYVTSGIYFATASARIEPESHGVFKEIADMKKNNSVKIEIIGHTDNLGNAVANQKLSEQRAIAVKTYLNETFNIDRNRISTSGKGAIELAVSNATAEGEAQNRRVEFLTL